MAEKFKKLSLFAERMVPEFIRNQYPNFVTFVTKYFEFLESSGEPYDLLRQILEMRDVDNSIQQFGEYYRQIYASDIPKSIRADLKLVLMHIREFFSKKGTEESFQFIFRTIFDEPIEFYYPRVDILRASDGKWVKPLYITIQHTDGTFLDIHEVAADWLFKDIVGLTSGDVGYVNAIAEMVNPSDDPLNPVLPPVYGISVVGSSEGFVEGEQIRYRYDANSTPVQVATSVPGGPATIAPQPGSWSNTDGFLSSNKYIQDNYYYQEHSYQIRCAMSSDFYWRTIRKNTHPAGTIFFGVVDFLNGLLANGGDQLQAHLAQQSIIWITTASAGSTLQTSDQQMVYEWATTVVAGAWTYAFVELYRELPPLNVLFNASSFDTLTINTFQTNANQSFPFAPPSELIVV